MKVRGAEIIVKTLIDQGVEVIFGYPGGAVIEIYDALYDHKDKIKHVITAHEQGAAHAAEGYAKSTGKTGVALATSGPGATNLVTGIADAYLDSVPTVFLTGNVPTNLIGKDSFQEIYTAGITMPITKHNFVVRRVQDLAPTIREAFRIAQSDRPGPVLVDIPKDMTMALCEYTEVKPTKLEERKYEDIEKLKEVADLINEAKKPVIYSGGGVVASEASEIMREFMKRANIPACHTIMAAGILGYKDRLNLGMVGMHGNYSSNKAIDQADLLLAIGVRFSDRVALNSKKFGHNAKIVHIDIDASEINKNVLIDHHLVGDVKDIVGKMFPYIEEKNREDWLAQIDEWRKEDHKPQDDEETIRPHQLMGTISEKAGQGAIIVTDVGQHQMWAAQYCGRVNPRNFLTSGGLGTMGFGYGAAMGAQVANPKKHVIHVTGDGSFHMNMNETITAVKSGLPIVTVIMNNKALGMVRQWQYHFYNQRYSETDLFHEIDYIKFAEAVGAKGYRCTNINEFRQAFDEALKRKEGPTIIECIIDRDEKVWPIIPSGKTVDDIILL